METQKIINLLNDSSNEKSKFATKEVKQQKGNTTKVFLLSLRQKLLNQVFLIILMSLF